MNTNCLRFQYPHWNSQNQSTNFTSWLFKMCKLLQVKDLKNSVYHPKTDDLCRLKWLSLGHVTPIPTACHQRSTTVFQWVFCSSLKRTGKDASIWWGLLPRKIWMQLSESRSAISTDTLVRWFTNPVAGCCCCLRQLQAKYWQHSRDRLISSTERAMWIMNCSILTKEKKHKFIVWT